MPTRFMVLILIMVFSIHSSVQALDWAYPFVVWDGRVYKVTDEEVLNSSKIGKCIGEVTTRPNELTGKYFGNASNSFPIGTPYFEIIGVSPETEMAVRVEQKKWIKAIYVHEAPFHWMNFLAKFFPYLIVLLGLFVFIYKRFRKRG